MDSLNSDVRKIIAPILKDGGIGVIPTDTLYGIVGTALDKKTVERIYALRKRETKKPMIVMISSLKDLELFDVRLSDFQKKFLNKNWPGKLSVILKCPGKKWEHLHRGKKTMAFRLPEEKTLRKLLKKTGPLIAPSANIAGQMPASTPKEAMGYFVNEIDFYVDAGKLKSKPSTLITLDENASVKILRQGAVKI